MNINGHSSKLMKNITALEFSLSSEGQQVIVNSSNREKEEKSCSDGNVSSIMNAANKRVDFNFIRKNIYSTNVSEQSSCGSTVHHASSLPDSLDGGRNEVNDLITLPYNFETALRINQALQRRFGGTLNKLTLALELNLKRQNQIRHDKEEEGLVALFDKDLLEAREQYSAKPSSFAVPYFKDRSGLPAPMNNDAKLKVDQGYLDLYTTKTRTWLTSEITVLIEEVQKEWKQRQLKLFNNQLQNYEKRIELSMISEIDEEIMKEETEKLKSKVQYFFITDKTELNIPRNSELDWDSIAVSAFNGDRSAEDCRLLWENRLHPSISKDQWQEKEDIFIQEHVTCNKFPNSVDWKTMAQNLNTGRTAFQCMQRWVSYIEPTLNPARWSAEDTRRLEDTICMLRIGSYIPWTQVTQHLTGFTAAQVQSRWRIIDPEQMKGPFSMKEDFMLIKGFTMFGLNFEMVAHYLPGRNKFQVRRRFSRTLLRGLTTNPWTVNEDKIIMVNSSISNQHWRMLAASMPKRNPCEIRVRFYTLHIWQEHSQQKVLPPPLFPISKTKKLGEIREIREKLINLSRSCADINKYIDNVSKKHMPIKTLEDRRQVIRNIQKRKACKMSQDSPLPKLKKRKGHRGPRTPNWSDMALTEYFLPGRSNDGYTEVPQGHTASKYMTILADALQLHLTQTISDEFLENYYRLNLNEQDALIIDDLAIEHFHSMNEEDPECKACLKLETDRPISIPLIPPNHSTVGAFKSFLFNKQKLNEMASKEFLFFQIPKNQLNKLGVKPNTLLSQKLNSLNEQASHDNLKDSNTGEEIYSPSKSKRKAAKKANLLNLVFSSNDVRDSLMHKLNPKVNGFDAIEVPTDKKFMTLLTQSELPHLCPRQSLSLPKKKTIEKEDTLLFHRFMALFFWPALFTLEKPSMMDLQMSEILAEKVELDQYEKNHTDEVLNFSHRHQYKSLTIDEQTELLELMESDQHRKKLFYQPMNVTQTTNLDDTDIVESKKKNGGRKKKIIMLKRSLIMKKVWDDRRKGLCPNRKMRNQPPAKKEPLKSRSSNRTRRSTYKI